MSRRHRKVMAEINVVPYIDVMLVLLVIFMVTTPLITQGVKIDLPQADANPVESDNNQTPLVVSVDKNGSFYLQESRDPMAADDLFVRMAAAYRLNPQQAVYVRGDSDTQYGLVVELMALIQKAGFPSVGLLTSTPERSNQGG